MKELKKVPIELVKYENHKMTMLMESGEIEKAQAVSFLILQYQIDEKTLDDVFQSIIML